MENLLESNERTLVMFDSVCSGLTSCLALVHADIKQMTEHRNKLAQLEQEQIQAKLVSPQELIVLTNNNNNNNIIGGKQNKRSLINQQPTQQESTKKSEINQDDDPHHLAGLKLLDKRLADSFSQALSLNDLQKSSIAAKQLASHNRPSIFQVLLGKSSSKTASKKHDAAKNAIDNNNSEPLDNRMIIDDINRQTRLAMQYSKQLEAHLLKVENLRSKYEMHLKMGLVVKSVARAYLTSNNQQSALNNHHPSPGTLARRHHCSSLVINDSSSMGTHSSLSSLNLSTWSSSRSRGQNQNSNQRRGGQNLNDSTNSNRRLNNNGQMFVSTISLSQANKSPHRRLNLAKLISPSSSASPNSTAVLKSQRDSYLDLDQSHNGSSMLIENNNNNNPQSKQRRISSQSSCMNNYATYTDWNLATEPNNYGQYQGDHQHHGVTDTLSKSSNNLVASRSSLKGLKGSSKSNQQASSKTTIKEFIDNIDRIEAEFESYMGSFMLTIEDIQGFARICQGDVFEISIKYGDAQKFKTKISVLKDNRQKCDNSQSVFKARIADALAIKAYECKGLGKRVLLGHKMCETRDLFTARSQLMTISLNQTGSIKLNLIITWNPLHLTPNSTTAMPGVDLSHISLPPTPVSSSTLSSLSSVPSSNGATTTINIKSQNGIKSAETTKDFHHQQQQLMHQNESLYQTVDPTYGYYIPPPDYVTNELKYRDV